MQSSQYSRGFSPPTSSDSLRCTTRTMSSSICRSSLLCSPRFRFQVCHVEHRFHSSGSQPVCTHLSNPYQPFAPSANTGIITPTSTRARSTRCSNSYWQCHVMVGNEPHHPEAFQLPSSCCPKSGHKRYCSHIQPNFPRSKPGVVWLPERALSHIRHDLESYLQVVLRSTITALNKTFKTFPLVDSASGLQGEFVDGDKRQSALVCWGLWTGA